MLCCGLDVICMLKMTLCPNAVLHSIKLYKSENEGKSVCEVFFGIIPIVWRSAHMIFFPVCTVCMRDQNQLSSLNRSISSD